MRTPTFLAVGALLCTLALSSCAPDASTDAGPSRSPAPTPPAPATVTAVPTAESTAPAADAEPTCENIITEGTVDALTSQGWTAELVELRAPLEDGGVVIEDGLLCKWADYDEPSDHGQMYGWGRLDASTAERAESALLREGWLRSTDGGRTYITEDPAYSIATDEDGFGMTYEFGDGWVKFADTKQGLLLIDGKG